ncbi:MAG: hypothetical protein JST79_21185 [Acidobacteria bacterium]|jgi:hypothetical protein|nr:hypothetical protein [Acidobacteriota bacterium]
MTFHSPAEDLAATTLESISGRLRRLEYLAGLRDGGGTYIHWGLSRVHGEYAANKALASAHRSSFSQVLSTPLETLLREVEQASEALGISPQRYVQELSNQIDGLMPGKLGAGAVRHFNSVLRALSSLARQKPDATRLAS